jgi:hypothetical protein
LLYTSSNIRRAQIKREELERPDCNAPSEVWGEEDEQFELGLEKWGVDIDDLKKPIRPRRLFKAWVEEWEDVMDKGDVMRTKLLAEYGGLVFDDIDAVPAVRMEVLIELIKTTVQPEDLNVRVALNEQEARASDSSNNERDESDSDEE